MRALLGAAWCVVVAAALTASAGSGDLEALRAENARLRARIEELERQNATLRDAAGDAPPPFPARIVERTAADGTRVDATEPAEIDVRGSRARHWMWLERPPAPRDAVLWLRAAYSGGVYGRAGRLELRLDGAAHSLPIASYDADRLTTGPAHRPLRRDHERLSVSLGPPVLDALARAVTLEGRVGRTRFSVPPEALASLRALARRPPAPAATGGPPASTARPPSPR